MKELSGDFIFLIDRSASMKCERIEKVDNVC
jgi:Mg-chelatase subunit ChlD